MRYWYGVIGICVLLSMIFVWNLSLDRAEGIHIVSVGQGDGAYIEYEGRRFLIDVGKDDSLFSYIDEVIEGPRFIDGIFISHNQYDHMGGLTRIMRTFPIGFIAFASPVSDEMESLCRIGSILCVVLSGGDRVEGDDITIRVLWPPKEGTFSDLNEGSLVLHVTLGEMRVLFTGDITSSIEKKLVTLYGEHLFSHVLKVPHHGSAYSSSPVFLNMVSPLVSVVSVGENTYGHPSAYIEDVLHEIGSSLFRTDRDGTVYIHWEDGEMHVVTER